MASRPSRTTRSSTAASTAPATTTTTGPMATRTRTTRQSSTAAPSTATTDSPSTSAAPRRTTRASRAMTPSLDSRPPSRSNSRASAARTTSATASRTRASTAAAPPPPPPRPSVATPKPLWTSTRTNATATSSRLVSPPVATEQGGKRQSLAVPKPRATAGGFLRKMSSRDHMKPPATPGPSQRMSTIPGTPAVVKESGVGAFEGPREPIKAYLRIRPPPIGASAESYIQVVGDSEVLMVPPSDHRLNPSSSSSSLFANALLRSSNLHLNPSSHPHGYPDDLLASSTTGPPSSGPDPSTFGTLYKFTSVFPHSTSTSPTSPSFPSGQTSQSDFFRSTTLPLVTDFLENGENCLLFAYGPSGSGKTYTVQGGNGDDAGILPRVMDIVWRSLEGRDANVRDRSNQPRPRALEGD
ncbi:hypothetical protein JCM10212_006217 [Sporobolomyces blumeae]